METRINKQILTPEIEAKFNNYPRVLATIEAYLSLPYVKDDIEHLLEALHSDNNGSISIPSKDNLVLLEWEIASSISCHDDLIRLKLIPPDTNWSIKTSGVMTGLVLYIKNVYGQPETVFVRAYRDKLYRDTYLDFKELHDYAIFTIAKRCGVSVPKVKYKSGYDIHGRKVYIFSTHVAALRNNRPNKAYQFFERVRQDNFQDIELDKISAARLRIMTEIFGLIDLHDGNVGFVISVNKSKNPVIVKKKLCAVDVGTRDAIYVYSDLGDFVKLDMFEQDLYKTLMPEDYIKAFAKIEENFISSCDDMLKQVGKLDYSSEMEKKTEFFKSVEVWKSNFEKIRKLMRKAPAPDRISVQ